MSGGPLPVRSSDVSVSHVLNAKTKGALVHPESKALNASSLFRRRNTQGSAPLFKYLVAKGGITQKDQGNLIMSVQNTYSYNDFNQPTLFLDKLLH